MRLQLCKIFSACSLNATFEGYTPWTTNVHMYSMEDFFQVLPYMQPLAVPSSQSFPEKDVVTVSVDLCVFAAKERSETEVPSVNAVKHVKNCVVSCGIIICTYSDNKNYNSREREILLVHLLFAWVRVCWKAWE